MRIEGQSCMILVPRPLASYKNNKPVSYSKYSLGIHYPDSSSMGVVSSPPPVETSADVASGSVQAVLHMLALWQRQLRKGHNQQQADRRQQGGLSAARGDQV